MSSETAFSIQKLEVRNGFPKKVVRVTIEAELTLAEYEDLSRGKWNGHPVFLTLGQMPLPDLTESNGDNENNSAQLPLEQAVNDNIPPTTDADREEMLEAARRRAEDYKGPTEFDPTDPEPPGYFCSPHGETHWNLELWIPPTGKVAHITAEHEALCGNVKITDKGGTRLQTYGDTPACTRCEKQHAGTSS